MAEPGEFTRRAFLNDRIDLAQAEAIADLIDATTEEAVRSASRSLSGVFSKEIHELVANIIQLRMMVESSLDFPEEDIDFLKKENVEGQIANIQEALSSHHCPVRSGRIVKRRYPRRTGWPDQCRQIVLIEYPGRFQCRHRHPDSRNDTGQNYRNHPD